MSGRLNEVNIRMSDGCTIHAVWMKPKKELIGHVHIFHGMAEHIGRYEPFMEYLCSNGYAVSGHDHRGHGQTALKAGNLGHFGDNIGFDRIVEDGNEIIEHFKTIIPANRFILFGHSMGSFIARRYAQLFGDKLDMLICSGTGNDPKWSRKAGKALAMLRRKMSGADKPDVLLNSLVFGNYSKTVKNAETPFDWLSRDKASVGKYIEDPLCGFVSTTQFFINLFEGIGTIHMVKNIEYMPKDLRILLLSGEDDPVGGFGKGIYKVADQYDQAGLKDVTVMLYTGGRHEMLHETNRQEVFEFTKKWIERK